MDHGCASGVTAGLENSVLESGLASGAPWFAVAFEFGGTQLRLLWRFCCLSRVVA